MKLTTLLYAGLIAAFALTGCARAKSEPASQAPAAQTTAGQTQTESPAASSDSQTAYHKITAEEAKEMIDNGGVTIVDVRRPDEYEAEHIPDAINVPNEDIGKEPPAALPDLDAVLLVHCRTGIRSKAASDKLVQMGYKNIYDFGGIVDWPYETE